MFSFFRKRRRRKLLDEPFPPGWADFLARNVGHYSRLAPAEQARLRDTTVILVAEKEWESVGGLLVSEEMKVTIAAQAGLLLLGLPDHDYFSRVPSIVVWPGQQEIPDRDEFGDIDDTFPPRVTEGLAAYRGPVVVSWEHAREEGRDPDCGYNVVIHEFAHQLDALDGGFDGTPPLTDPVLAAKWTKIMQAAFDDHRRAVDRKEETFLSEQAADNESEFFADATEAFYCRPVDLKELHPEVYQLLAAYYRVEPVRWFPESL